MSVSECVKLRERHRAKEREAQREAAAEAKALREAAKAQAGSSEGGWAQVAASKRNNGVSSARNTPLSRTPIGPGSGSLYAALAMNDDGSSVGGSGVKKEKLVLRSGVGASKQARRSSPLQSTEVADSWEEEEEKEEQEEERRARESEVSGSTGTRTPEVVEGNRDSGNETAAGTASSESLPASEGERTQADETTVCF
jgi:transcriptional repressor NF-X1